MRFDWSQHMQDRKDAEFQRSQRCGGGGGVIREASDYAPAEPGEVELEWALWMMDCMAREWRGQCRAYRLEETF